MSTKMNTPGKQGKCIQTCKTVFKLPKQQLSLGDWTDSMIKKVFEEEGEFLVQSLNKAVDDFFPLKEMESLVSKRLLEYDDHGKKLPGIGHPRVSLAVGQSTAHAKRFFDGKHTLFENALVEFYQSLFVSDERTGARVCAQGKGVLHVLVMNDFLELDGKLYKKSFQIIGAASFKLMDECSYLMYLGVRHSNAVWPDHIYDRKSEETTNCSM
jgi:hypothetical protein